MATKPYFLWGDTHAASIPASGSDVAVFASSAPHTTTELAAAGDTKLAAASPELGAVAVARPRLRRNSSGSGTKQQQQQQQQAGGVGAKKPPQRGLGVAELERLRCGGDPLLDLSAVVGDVAGAQGHALLHYHHQPHTHLQIPASAFEAAAGGARYCSQLLAPAPPPGRPPVCILHPPAAVGCHQRAPPVAPEQQYFKDRWSRMGGFSSSTAGAGADHHQSQLLPATLAPEHPSSQSTIWRPAVSSSCCLHTGHRCDICSRRMRTLAESGGALAPTPPDYSIYDLATAMAAARQGDAFLAWERKRGAAEAEAPAKEDVREIEFFPAASAHHTGGGGFRAQPELAAPFSSPLYGAGANHAAPQLDLSLRL